MLRRAVLVPVCLTTLALGAVACSSSDGPTIAVTATDRKCTSNTASVASGEVRIEVSNKGKKVTEVYVYGAEDRVMGEVENIGPGTSRDFSVKLSGGPYEIACKPGQKGDGIRTPLVVTGKEEKAAKADRVIAFDAVDFSFEGVDDLEVTEGETIEFRMHNEGAVAHEFEVLDAEGAALGEVGPTDPDATGAVTITFETSGSYTYICDIDDHRKRGMSGRFSVS